LRRIDVGIAPSILSFDLTDLRESVAEMERAGASILHLDVMDGTFVPPISFGDGYVKDLRTASTALFEAHLMVDAPERQFEAFAKAGCGRIIFHLEGTHHAHRLAQMLKEMDVSPGIALNPGTPFEAAEPLLKIVDLVLVMTVNPGWGGQSLLPSTLEKVRRVRAAAPAEMHIEVDGGITPETLPMAKAAGADVFVVGSHLAKASDLHAETARMVAMC
jgi:ribulose-phosphate 3-epimerase